MILKVKGELVDIYLEYDENGNIDIRTCKVAETSLNTYTIGYFSRYDGSLHLIPTIGGSGLPINTKTGKLQIN